jgi:hypothetical protein
MDEILSLTPYNTLKVGVGCLSPRAKRSKSLQIIVVFAYPNNSSASSRKYRDALPPVRGFAKKQTSSSGLTNVENARVPSETRLNTFSAAKITDGTSRRVVVPRTLICCVHERKNTPVLSHMIDDLCRTDDIQPLRLMYMWLGQRMRNDSVAVARSGSIAAWRVTTLISSTDASIARVCLDQDALGSGLASLR